MRDLIRGIGLRAVPAPILAALKRRRQRRAITEFSPREVRHRYGAVPLTIRLEDPLAAGWYDRDWDVLPEITLLQRSRLEPGALVFDLGAHQGVVALILADIVGPHGRVIAVEANRHNARLARINAERNGAAQLEVVHGAIARSDGRLWFNENLNGQVDDGSGTAGRVAVQAYSIDSLALQYGQPDVLFIDVEGFECEALAGASQTLHAGVDCLVEVHVDAGLEQLGGSIDRVLRFFPSDRYRLLMAGGDDDREFEDFRPDSPVLASRFFLAALAR